MRVIPAIVLVLVSIGVWFVFWLPDAETKRSAILVKDFRNTMTLLTSINVAQALASIEECDVILELNGEDEQSFGTLIPQDSKGFIVKFCKSTEFTINGSSPPNTLLGVFGMTFGERELSNANGEKTIHVYAPTNGTDSVGDAVIGLWRNDQDSRLRQWFPIP